MNKKTVIAVSAVLIITAGVFAAIFAFWPSAKKDTEEPVALKYENADLGFSIKYLSDWTIDIQDAEKGSIYFAGPGKKNAVNQFDISVSAYDSVASLPGNDSKETSLKSFLERPEFTGLTAEIVGGKLAYMVRSNDGLWPIMFFSESGGKVYRIGIADANPSQDVVEVAKSLRFTSGEVK